MSILPIMGSTTKSRDALKNMEVPKTNKGMERSLVTRETTPASTGEPGVTCFIGLGDYMLGMNSYTDTGSYRGTGPVEESTEMPIPDFPQRICAAVVILLA